MNDPILKLLKERYFLESETTWEELARRIGSIYEPITDDIINMRFIPSSPTLMNGGTTERVGTLSSCFPMKIEDSIKDIFMAIAEGADITKAGGGIGVDFSVLRSSQENILTLNANSSGPVAFMEGFNTMLDIIRQGGRRRGAGMALLSIEHPDILQFITVKDDVTKMNRLNLSIKIPNVFYEKLEKEPNSIHQVKDKNGNYFDLLDDSKNPITVKKIWDMLIYQAWKCAEPGIFNETIAYDRCTVTNLDKQVICNPCQEFTGIPYQSCNLGSINLLKMLDGSKFNWERFKELIKETTRFIDHAIDVNNYPLEKIKKITLDTRPIGLGTMGLAHILFKKRIPYNSEKAIKFSEELFRYLTLVSMQESVKLSKEDGGTKTKSGDDIGRFGAYPAFDYNLFMKANERFFTKNCRDIDIDQLKKEIKKYGVRNSCFTSQAPTGTISFLANVSSGIEPVFGLVYSRKIEKLNKEYEVVYLSDPIFEEYLNENFTPEIKDKILKEVSENNGSCQNCKNIPEDIRKIFVTAGDLKPMEHLDVLEAVANNISLSASKTINMSSTATKEEVAEVFLEAYKRGIIGTTVYRDGCREGILVHNNAVIKTLRDAPKRLKELPCEIHRVTYQGKMWIVFVGLYEDKPFEVFAGAVEDVNIPKNITEGFIVKQKSSHYSFKYDGEIIVNNIMKTFSNKEHDDRARSISLELRHSIPLKYIVGILNKSEGDVTHFSKVIARTLKKYISDGEDAGKCQQCGSKLIYYDGCIKCSNPECGFSKCG
jgi:ribonucleoside-diphosphate reductase alpha chain